MIENEAAKFSSKASADIVGEERSERSVAHPRRSARELNPGLFGDSNKRSGVIDGSATTHLPQLMQADQKIQDVKAQVSMMAEHMGKWTEQHGEFVKNCQQKFDRVQQVLMKLESNDQYIVNETSQKFSRINDRLGERKSVDAKIQEMIDRHNSVLKSFEMRLSQLQRVLSEKEAQLLSTQAVLNETKMEIARLKRL